MKSLLVFGTRPEAIKLAPLVAALKKRPGDVCRICVTAQHRGLLDQVLALFGLKPDHDLDLMTADQTLHQVAARTLEGLPPILAQERPDWVVVQGDANSAAAAALAAFYAAVPVAHVEAGVRTGDLSRPFPEEANRKVIDALATLHLAATQTARENLLREGAPAEGIFVTGNTVVDALQWVLSLPAPAETAAQLERLGVARPGGPGRKLLLVTAHRRESFGEPLARVFTALRALAQARPDVAVVLSVHPNPSVRRQALRLLDGVERVLLLPAVDYAAMAHLMRRSRLLLTDSGGLQEEAPSLGLPVLVLRDVTDRPEAVAAGAALLVGTDPERITRETLALLDDDARCARMKPAVNPYGDGHAAERIAQVLAAQRRAGPARSADHPDP
jgi:UDP-N-acetylglucosamine 2-epimerase (non-hydrolysing)